MKVVIVGTGYVGLVTGTCLSDVGIEAVCVDIDQKKIDNLHKGVIPIYEPGLEKLVLRNVEQGRLKFSTSLKDSIVGAEAIFIAVGTPPLEDGSADLKYVLAVAKEIGESIQDYAVVITKSTVPIGSSHKVRHAVQAALDARNSSLSFDIASNPEFLKEGSALKDFMSPDRIVVGTDSERAAAVMDHIYKPFLLNGYRIVHMDIPSAEMTKYAANSMLATRISFMNDIAGLCEKVGANVDYVRAGIGADPRIGKKFLYAGIGYGGSCFPKDVKALIHIGQEHGHEMKILEAVEEVNESQKEVLFDKILRYFDGNISGKTIAIWGLAFKPNTDDMREAPAIVLINKLLSAGAKIKATDPVAMDVAKQYYLKNIPVTYCKDVYETADGADAIALVTEWNEFRLPDWKRIEDLVSEKVVFDGRNIYDPLNLKEFKVYSIGK